jgi:hypothetical protein
MKLLFKSQTPDRLESEIFTLTSESDLKTWEIHMSENKRYLKHTQQWGEKGVISLKVDKVRNYVIVEVLKYINIEEDIKNFEGYYLGRFCELMFVYFPNQFSSIEKE